MAIKTPGEICQDQGLIFHNDGERYRPDGHFVPWNRVVGFELISHRRSGGRMHWIKVAVHWDESFPRPESIGLPTTNEKSNNSAWIEAGGPRPGKKKLLKLLERLHAQYGNPEAANGAAK